MAGKVRKSAAKSAVSTGGSLISEAKLKQLYATMVQCRLLTERALRLRSRPALTGFYAASMGQEAMATGCVVDLQPEDTVALAPRNSIAGLVKGVPLGDMAALMYAPHTRTRGKRTLTAPHNVIPSSSSPATRIGAALDAASTHRRKKNGNVVVAFTGAAGNMFGGWNKAMEAATRRGLPIIFVAENNPWGERAGFEDDTEEFAEKARGHGLPVITVDGNDVVAVYRVAFESLERVRQGAGPVLVEGKTYRLDGHAPRAAETLKAWRRERDPLTRMERYLNAKRLFTAGWKNQIAQQFSRELDAAMRASRRAASKAQRAPRG